MSNAADQQDAFAAVFERFNVCLNHSLSPYSSQSMTSAKPLARTSLYVTHVKSSQGARYVYSHSADLCYVMHGFASA